MARLSLEGFLGVGFLRRTNRSYSSARAPNKPQNLDKMGKNEKEYRSRYHPPKDEQNEEHQ